jgi:hypothetical protein
MKSNNLSPNYIRKESKTMKNIRQILAIVSVALLLGAAAAYAEIPENEKILVTDPDLLEQMGFDPGDTVYMWTGGSFHGEFADFMASEGVELPSASGDEENPNFTTFGPASAYWPVSGRQFEGRNFDFNKRSRIGHDDIYRSGPEQFADAQLYLPSGADLQFIRTWGFDSNGADNIVFFLFQICLPDFGAAASNLTQVLSFATGGAPGNFSIFTSVPGILNIDNQSCTYQLRARFDATGTSLNLNKARAQYVRQVSPIPPGPPSFSDIGGHPRRQSIEALAASGITGGFGDGTFRPDNFVTRGQMAAFLARALGLHWASF